MKRKVVLLLGLALWLAFTGTGWAQSAGGYELGGWVVPGGGDLTPNGGGYMLMGAAGQPEVGAVLTGGDYALVGGFWLGDGTGDGYILYLYLPIMSKNE